MPDEQDIPNPEDQIPEDGTPEPEPQDESEAGAEDVTDDEPAEEEPPQMNETEASALAAAMQAINQVQGVADSAVTGGVSKDRDDDASPFSAPEFGEPEYEGAKGAIELLSDVHMDVRIELGRTRMYVEDVLKLNDGAVVELDKLAGDPVDVYVNDRRVACGEVLVLNDMFCVRINEVIDITQSDD